MIRNSRKQSKRKAMVPYFSFTLFPIQFKLSNKLLFHFILLHIRFERFQNTKCRCPVYMEKVFALENRWIVRSIFNEQWVLALDVRIAHRLNGWYCKILETKPYPSNWMTFAQGLIRLVCMVKIIMYYYYYYHSRYEFCIQVYIAFALGK